MERFRLSEQDSGEKLSKKAVSDLRAGLQVLKVDSLTPSHITIDQLYIMTEDLDRKNARSVSLEVGNTFGYELRHYHSAPSNIFSKLGEMPLDQFASEMFGLESTQFIKLLLRHDLGTVGPLLDSLRKPKASVDVPAAMTYKGNYFEVPVVIWDQSKQDWAWIVIKSNPQEVNVQTWSTRQIKSIKKANELSYSDYDPSGYSFYKPDTERMMRESIQGIESMDHQQVKQVLEEIKQRREDGMDKVLVMMDLIMEDSRQLPIYSDFVNHMAVMLISSEDAEINRKRAKVGCVVWKFYSEVARASGQSTPRLICNGYSWNVSDMRAEARVLGIPQESVVDVVLNYPATTMDHGKRMIERIDLENFPQRVLVCTSTEHLPRTLLHLVDQIGFASSLPSEYRVGLHPVEMPTNVNPVNDLIEHEIKTLKRWQSSFIEEKGFWKTDSLYYATRIESRSIWARNATGLGLSSLDKAN